MSYIILLTLYFVVLLVRVSRHYITDIVFCSTLSESLSYFVVHEILLTLYFVVPLVRVSLTFTKGHNVYP